jgi:hypothetical protein
VSVEVCCTHVPTRLKCKGYRLTLNYIVLVWLWDAQPEDDYLKALKRLGPIYRYLIRPVERTFRRVFHKLYGRQLQLLFAKTNAGIVLAETLQDGFQIAWVALLLYSFVWAWFTW